VTDKRLKDPADLAGPDIVTETTEIYQNPKQWQKSWRLLMIARTGRINVRFSPTGVKFIVKVRVRLASGSGRQRRAWD
jgi:hypothetical protein